MTSTEKTAVNKAVIIKSNESEVDEVLEQVLFSELVQPSGKTLDIETSKHGRLLIHSKNIFISEIKTIYN